MSQLAQLLMLGVSIGVIYGLVAMGLVLIYRASGVLNFAQGQMIVFGAMITWAFMAQIGLSWWLSIILALACAWILGMLIERLTIRPMLGQPVLSVIVMTLGLGVVLEALIVLIWGAKGRGYPSTPFPSEAIYIGGINLPPVQLYSIVIALVIFWGLVYYLSRSREGLAMQAIADDTQCARSLGVKASSILSSTWSLAAIVALVGGYLLASIVSIDISSMPGFGFKAIAAMLVGGMESIAGAICGGLLIGIAECLAAGYLDPIVGGGLKNVFPFIILMIVLFVRPYGFFGWKRIERV